MADGGIGNQSPATLFQARLSTADNTGPTLTLGRYQGNKVVVNGLTVAVPQTGLIRNIIDNLIDASGADAGAGPVASTLYYVYVSNRMASFSPESIRLSATAPVLRNGVKYLGLTGNAAEWRFVGWVFPNATPAFQSDGTYRGIVNYYNRLRLPFNANMSSDFAETASGAYVEFGTAKGLKATFISNGEDSVEYRVFSTIEFSNVGIAALGIAFDSTVTPTRAQYYDRTSVNAFFSVVVGLCQDLSEGEHYATCLSAATQTGTIHAAINTFGASPPCAFMAGSIFG